MFYSECCELIRHQIANLNGSRCVFPHVYPPLTVLPFSSQNRKHIQAFASTAEVYLDHFIGFKTFVQMSFTQRLSQNSECISYDAPLGVILPDMLIRLKGLCYALEHDYEAALFNHFFLLEPLHHGTLTFWTNNTPDFSFKTIGREDWYFLEIDIFIECMLYSFSFCDVCLTEQRLQDQERAGGSQLADTVGRHRFRRSRETTTRAQRQQEKSRSGELPWQQ